MGKSNTDGVSHHLLVACHIFHSLKPAKLHSTTAGRTSPPSISEFRREKDLFMHPHDVAYLLPYAHLGHPSVAFAPEEFFELNRLVDLFFFDDAIILIQAERSRSLAWYINIDDPDARSIEQ